MSLLRLLTAGKSLVGLKDGQVQYRMGDTRSMPKFGSSKNPFQGKGRAEAGQKEVGQSGEACNSSGGRANNGLVVEAAGSSHSVTADEQRPNMIGGACEPRRISEVCGLDNSGSLRKTSDTPRFTDSSQTLSEPLSSDTQSGTADAETAPLSPPTRKKWLSSLKSLFGMGPLRPDRKPGPTRAISQPVQGELRLDNVKVLRNDLSDTDLEIVAKPPPRQVTPPKPETAVPNETAWERVTTLFGAEK